MQEQLIDKVMDEIKKRMESQGAAAPTEAPAAAACAASAGCAPPDWVPCAA